MLMDLLTTFLQNVSQKKFVYVLQYIIAIQFNTFW